MGTYSVRAPQARSNSRMPLTELWLSKVSRNWSPGSKGYDSPTSLSAWLALAVIGAAFSLSSAILGPAFGTYVDHHRKHRAMTASISSR